MKIVFESQSVAAVDGIELFGVFGRPMTEPVMRSLAAMRRSAVKTANFREKLPGRLAGS